MKLLPDTEHPMVLRTDFTDDQAWKLICALVSSTIGRDGFQANAAFVGDPSFAGVTPEALHAMRPPLFGPELTFSDWITHWL